MRPTIGRRGFLAALLAAASLSGSCSGSPAPRQVQPVYDAATGKLQILKYDADNDGKAETVSYMDGSRIIRIEIDRDEDGKVDRWEHYDSNQKLDRVGFSRAADGKEDAWSYADANGAVVRIEIAGRGDGKVTRTEYYQADAIVRAEEDGDGDGHVDKWETYAADGRLTEVAFDTAHQGRPDRRLSYADNGEVHVEQLGSKE